MSQTARPLSLRVPRPALRWPPVRKLVIALALTAVILIVSGVIWSTRWQYQTLARDNGTAYLIRTNRYTDTVQIFVRSEWRTLTKH